MPKKFSERTTPFIQQTTPQEKGEMLAVAEAAHRLNPKQTLAETLNELGVSPHTANELSKPGANLRVEDGRVTVAEMMDNLVYQIVGLMPEKLEGASLSQLTDAMDKLVKNSQLLRGNPTEITASSQGERQARIKEILLKGNKQIQETLTQELLKRNAEVVSEVDADSRP